MDELPELAVRRRGFFRRHQTVEDQHARPVSANFTPEQIEQALQPFVLQRREGADVVAAVETPENFTTSRAVGAWIGLTLRRYQSGEIDCDGHISRRGDARLRALLYEASTGLLTRVRSESRLRRWGLTLKKRLGFKRAAVALARKMAVVMHAMWKTGADFEPEAATSTAA